MLVVTFAFHLCESRPQPLADKITSSKPITLNDILAHPVAIRYFMQHVAATDTTLSKSIKLFKSVEKYKKKVVPEKKMKKALKIFKKFIKGSEYIPKDVVGQIAEQVEQFDFAAQNMFEPISNILKAKCEVRCIRVLPHSKLICTSSHLPCGHARMAGVGSVVHEQPNDGHANQIVRPKEGHSEP